MASVSSISHEVSAARRNAAPVRPPRGASSQTAMPLPAESTADRAQPTGRYRLVGQARGLAQQSASFGVVGRDSHGRPVRSGAAKLRVQARGPGALRPRVVAKGAEGQYDVEFNATVSGTYELAVRAGHETLGPPTTLTIAASAACARASACVFSASSCWF